MRYKPIKSLFTMLLMSILCILPACQAVAPLADGYQFGDATRALIGLQADYCNNTIPLQRAAILAKIRESNPDYQPVCPQDAELLQLNQAEKPDIFLSHDSLFFDRHKPLILLQVKFRKIDNCTFLGFSCYENRAGPEPDYVYI